MKSTSQCLQNRKVLNPVEEPCWCLRLARFHKRCLTVKLLQLLDDLQLRLGLRFLTKPSVPTCVSWDSPSCNVRSSRRSCSTCRWAPARHRSTPWSQRSSPVAEHRLISFSRRPRPSGPRLTYHFCAGDGVKGCSKQLPPVYKGLHDEVCHYKKSRRSLMRSLTLERATSTSRS